MYSLICIDHINKKQIVLDEVAYLDRANDLLLDYCLNFVLNKSGIDYLKRIFYRKIHLPAGYSIVNKNNDYLCKYTVYHREPNGYFLNGKITKIHTYLCIIQKPRFITYKTYKYDSKKYNYLNHKNKISEKTKENYQNVRKTFGDLMLEFSPMQLLSAINIKPFAEEEIAITQFIINNSTEE
jgi:hypothetical protein